MARVARDIVEKRPKEIMDACRKLYRTMPFNKITLKEIGAETSFSRPSIYNYFQTKEEIFLAILEDEYRLWNKKLERIISGHEKMDAESYSAAMAESLEGRETMLRILCMNLYEIEEHSRTERLVDFKRQYRRTVELVGSGLEKFFPSLGEKDRNIFIYEFFPFLYGLYPYAHPTEKQLEAMEKAGMHAERLAITDAVRRCVMDLLDKTM